MLWSTAYLESRLPSPLPTKDGGNLYAVKDVRAYVLGLAHSRSGHLYWQRAHQLLLDQADVVTLRRQVELALFCDAQLDLEAMDTADRPPAPTSFRVEAGLAGDRGQSAGAYGVG